MNEFSERFAQPPARQMKIAGRQQQRLRRLSALNAALNGLDEFVLVNRKGISNRRFKCVSEMSLLATRVVIVSEFSKRNRENKKIERIEEFPIIQCGNVKQSYPPWADSLVVTPVLEPSNSEPC
jgi:hypothetical protein